MDTLFFLLGFASLVLLVVGLIRPSLIVRWGSNRTRKPVVLIFGGATLVFLILFGITVEPQPKAQPTAEPKSEQQQQPVAEQGQELTTEEKKGIFTEIVKCEDKAEVDASIYYDALCSTCQGFIEGDVSKLNSKIGELQNKCRVDLRNNFGITEEVAEQISAEAFTEEWPLPQHTPFPPCCAY